MENFCVIIPFFQDKDAGLRLLGILIKKNIPSIWCDGSFKEFKQLHKCTDRSTDGFREILVEEPTATLIESLDGYITDKWNRMFQEVNRKGFDYCFLMGCDSIPKGDFGKAIEYTKPYLENSNSPHVFRIVMKEAGENDYWHDHDGPKEVLFFNPGRILVKDAHWSFYDRESIEAFPLQSYKNENIPEEICSFVHDNTARPKWRDDMMTEYQKVRVPKEHYQTQQAYLELLESEALGVDLLKKIYPNCPIEKRERDGKPVFIIRGDNLDSSKLDDFKSYFTMPVEDGIFVTKQRLLNKRVQVEYLGKKSGVNLKSYKLINE